MFLNSPERTLEGLFRVTHGENYFMVYASTESLKCFICSDQCHKRFTCPRRDEECASTSRDETDIEPEVNNTETERVEEQDRGDTEEVSDSDKAVSIGDENDQSDSDEDDTVQKFGSEENLADETESLSQMMG